MIQRKKPAEKPLKAQIQALENQVRLGRAKRAARLLEMSQATDFWMTSYVDVLDRYRDGAGVAYPISNATDRRYGSNFPFWTSESQLAIIRAGARVLVAMNPAAYGLVNGLTSYVIGSGYTYRVTGKPGSGVDDRIIQAAQKVVEEFLNDNSWPEIEQELFFRSREDGESFLRMFPQPSGSMIVRTVEPEQVMQPPNSDFAEWSYGIHTPSDDVFDILGYYVHYMSPGGADGTDTMGEVVSPDLMIHLKCNTKRAIKRGVSDFAFDTGEIFSQAAKLRRNMGEGAAVQAAIAAIRQHDTATASQVETFAGDMVDYTLYSPSTGRSQDFQRMDSGSFLDIPKGMNYIQPPGAANAPSHLSIHSALLRAAGVRHNAPEWLVSGDSSNNNYASSLTAESPFLRNCTRLQSFYQRPFLRVVRAAVAHAAAVGNLPGDIMRLVEVDSTPVSVETRNKAEEAAANQTYVTLGVKSKATVAAELGLDWQKEQREMDDMADRQGNPLAPLPTGPAGPEALESLNEARTIKRDKSGRFGSGGGSGGAKKKGKAGKEKAKAAPKKPKKPPESNKGKEVKSKPVAKPADKPAEPAAKAEPAKAEPAKAATPQRSGSSRPSLAQLGRPSSKPAGPSLGQRLKGLFSRGAAAVGGKIKAGGKALVQAAKASKLGREIKAGIADVRADIIDPARAKLAKAKAGVKGLVADFKKSTGGYDSRKKESVQEAGKYDGIDFSPPAGVRAAAERSLKVRAGKPASQRGMTAVGVARARDLANGRKVSPATARRMKAFFGRHEIDKKGATWDEQGAGWQAWHGWGGDAGYSWAKKLVKQLNAADKE
jgi:hypothetical protein